MKEFKTATFTFLPSQLSVHGMSAANSLSSKEAFCFESETTTKNAIYVGETSSKSDFLWLCWLKSNLFMAHYQFQSLGVHWSSNNEPVTGTNNHSLVFVSWHLGKFPVAFFYSLIKNTPCCLVCGLHSNHWGTKWAEREPAWCVWRGKGLGIREAKFQSWFCQCPAAWPWPVLSPLWALLLQLWNELTGSVCSM